VQPHEERVVTERGELAEKLIRLRAFIHTSPIFPKLPADEQVRLKTQEFHMSMYWTVLGERIYNFPTNSPAPDPARESNQKANE